MIGPAEAVDAALKEWKGEAFVRVYNDIELNLTGRVLKVDTGRLRSDVGTVSRIEPEGMQFGVRVKYGIAWELGFEVPEQIIRPKYAKALKIPVAGGFIFRKKAVIPAHKVAARPFILPAIEAHKEFLEDGFLEILDRKVADSLPSGVREI